MPRHHSTRSIEAVQSVRVMLYMRQTHLTWDDPLTFYAFTDWAPEAILNRLTVLRYKVTLIRCFDAELMAVYPLSYAIPPDALPIRCLNPPTKRKMSP
jgi:hypothetical protein